MKFFIDNNLPITLAHALDALVKPDHNAIHLQAKFKASTPDIDWITTLTKEGGWIILTNDAFREYAVERKALIESGLVVYWLKGKGWAKLNLLEKNLAVLEWTKVMVQHAEPVLIDAQKTKKGSAWSMNYKPNNRQFKIERDKF